MQSGLLTYVMVLGIILVTLFTKGMANAPQSTYGLSPLRQVQASGEYGNRLYKALCIWIDGGGLVCPWVTGSLMVNCRVGLQT